MSRFTTNNEVSKMGMYELALNSCYAKDGVARYRDFEKDIDARDFARDLMVSFGEWKKDGPDTDNEIVDDEIFDDTMLDNLSCEPNTIKGLIALFYRNLWAMADLRETLKEYEDSEEKGLLLKLPCKLGDKVYVLFEGAKQIKEYEVSSYKFYDDGLCMLLNQCLEISVDYLGEDLFLTKEEAEKKLKEMNKE